jgi:hypothetical protein
LQRKESPVRHRLLVLSLASFAFAQAAYADPADAGAMHVTAPLAAPGGDCNDTDAGVFPGQAENAGNRMDDDCDGLADEDAEGNPSMDANDMDGDTVSPATGDCDDTDPGVHPGQGEVPGNLFDDDCDGLADEDAQGNPSADSADHDDDGVPIGPDRLFASGFDE